MEINYSKQAQKFLSKQTREVQVRIVSAIDALPNGDIKKLHGKRGFRLRVGNFRVLFDKAGNVIYIERIENRGEAYKNRG